MMPPSPRPSARGSVVAVMLAPARAALSRQGSRRAGFQRQDVRELPTSRRRVAAGRGREAKRAAEAPVSRGARPAARDRSRPDARASRPPGRRVPARGPPLWLSLLTCVHLGGTWRESSKGVWRAETVETVDGRMPVPPPPHAPAPRRIMARGAARELSHRSMVRPSPAGKRRATTPGRSPRAAGLTGRVLDLRDRVDRPAVSTARLNQARASAEPREKAAAPFAKPVTKRSSSSAAAASIERRAPDAPAPVEESSIAAATRLRRAASVDARAPPAPRPRDASGAQNARAQLLCRDRQATGPPSRHPPERRQMRLRNSAVRRRADAGSTCPQGRIEGAGRFLRGPAAARDARLMESLSAGSKLAATERAAPLRQKSQRAGPPGWGWGRGVSWWRVLGAVSLRHFRVCHRASASRLPGAAALEPRTPSHAERPPQLVLVHLWLHFGAALLARLDLVGARRDQAVGPRPGTKLHESL